MKINGRAMRTIWPAADGSSVEIIDQRLLPHELVVARLRTLDDAALVARLDAVAGRVLKG